MTDEPTLESVYEIYQRLSKEDQKKFIKEVTRTNKDWSEYAEPILTYLKETGPIDMKLAIKMGMVPISTTAREWRRSVFPNVSKVARTEDLSVEFSATRGRNATAHIHLSTQETPKKVTFHYADQTAAQSIAVEVADKLSTTGKDLKTLIDLSKYPFLKKAGAKTLMDFKPLLFDELQKTNCTVDIRSNKLLLRRERR